MDSELLREACKRAGGRCPPPDEAFDRGWIFPDGTALVERSKALPSYVADLLVGMVRENDPDEMIGLAYFAALDDGTGYPEHGLATPEQRITAAMEVLPNE